MGMAAIGLGLLFCGSGALAHFQETGRHRESGFALGGFCFLVVGLFLTRG